MGVFSGFNPPEIYRSKSVRCGGIGFVSTLRDNSVGFGDMYFLGLKLCGSKHIVHQELVVVSALRPVVCEMYDKIGIVTRVLVFFYHIYVRFQLIVCCLLCLEVETFRTYDY